MAIAKSTNRFGVSWLLAVNCVFAFLLAAGASLADDTKKKVEAPSTVLYKQIEAAVLAGKITKEEAQAKLKALKEKGESKIKATKESAEQNTDTRTIAHVESIWKSLQSLVAAGKMSQDEANAVMSTIKKTVLAGGAAKEEGHGKPAFQDSYKQIEAAVIAGKITKEEARAKLRMLHQQDSSKKNVKESKKNDSSKVEQGKAATEAYLKKVWAELQEAVAAGKLTKEEAVAKMTAIKKAKASEK